jgi:quercetin 2,3-dioxygenase
MKTIRSVKQVITGIPTSDGDGVQLTRLIGSPQLNQLDPFLLFDAFGSNKPQDYIGGFPAHPHRGFETVTYMLAGKMRHKDSAGNQGVICAGDVQWMTAGKGIIHSEMPEQEQGLLAGFQLWVNLPAKAKMIAPKYQEVASANIKTEIQVEGVSIKVLAGDTEQGTKGVIVNDYVAPIYWDITLKPGTTFNQGLASELNGFIYVIAGSVKVADHQPLIEAGQLAVLTAGDQLQIQSQQEEQQKAQQETRLLLVAAKPLNEPVERAGPFVMNNKQQIQQAFADYQAGTLA